MGISRSSAVAILVVACVASPLGPGIASAQPAKAKLTIEARPDGVRGHVSSTGSERCAAKRRIVVFQKRGQRRLPSRDRRIAGTRSGKRESAYGWSLKTRRTGELYAVAPRRPGCAASLSGVVRSHPPGQPIGGGDRTDYPPCSPYSSEGYTAICRIDQLHLSLRAEGPSRPCRIGNASGDCPGDVTAGQFPWGETGTADRPIVRVVWGPIADGKGLKIYSFRRNEPNTILASLLGSVPNAGSPRFSINEGYAQSEKGFPDGDYFNTPDLPGQAAGEPGGPLAINFQNGSGLNFGAEVDITGYLYLRP